jgi:DNA-binding response OmpR family regulator/predicted ATPase
MQGGARVLLVESDVALRRSIVSALVDAGHHVTTATDRASARKEATRSTPDAVVLSTSLAADGATALLRGWRREGRSCPVLLLTRPGEEQSRDAALAAGAADFVVPPFSGAELATRIDAALGGTITPGSIVRLTAAVVDLNRRTVERDGVTQRLTAKEADLLAWLSARPGRTVPRDVLLREVWGYARGVESRAIDNTIRRLRGKVEAEAADPVHILTVYGIGYRFEALPSDLQPTVPVSPTAPTAASRSPTAASPSESPTPAPTATTAPPTERAPAPRVGRGRTAFFGRDEDTAQVRELLAGGTRLLTLVGTAGIGKTRLAREVGAGDRWPGGTWIVNVAAARSAAEVTAAIASEVDPQGEAGDPFSALAANAKNGSLLLILDNFEGAVATADDTVGAWLATVPEVAVLVTSRERLGLPEEVVYEVAPLSPEAAAALFDDRARQARGHRPNVTPDPAAVAEIVVRLDHLPLAIELAAARAAVLPERKLLARLDERFRVLRAPDPGADPRQRTLRGALDWSWDLLADWERQALRQCAVFRGGFSLEAAEQVVRLDNEDVEVLDAIDGLVRRSLVQTEPAPGVPDDVRFQLFESVRAYGEDRLGDAEEREPTEARHTDWALSHGEALARGVDRHGGVDRLHRLALERDNLLAVHARALPERPDIAMRAALALYRTLSLRGANAVLEELFDAALVDAAGSAPASSGAPLPDELRTWGLLRRGQVRRDRGRAQAALDDLRAALEAAAPTGDAGLQGHVTHALGLACLRAGHLDEASLYLDEARRLLLEAGEDGLLGVTEGWRGLLAWRRATPEEAIGHLDAALRLHQDTGARPGEGRLLTERALLHFVLGDGDAARDALDRADDILADVGDIEGRAAALVVTATVRERPSALQDAAFLLDPNADADATQAFATAARALLDVRAALAKGPALGPLETARSTAGAGSLAPGARRWLRGALSALGAAPIR